MWECISKHSSMGINGKSYRSKIGKLENRFDIGIFFSSCESRGIEAAKALYKNSCENSLIILFKEKDNLGLRDKYDKILAQLVLHHLLGFLALF